MSKAYYSPTVIHSIAWGNPYTQPPYDLPRTLIEVEHPRTSGIPTAITVVLDSLGFGTGWALCFRPAIDPAARRFTDEQKQAMRRRNLERRIRAKFPMFAAEMIAAALKAKPEYYGEDYAN